MVVAKYNLEDYANLDNIEILSNDSIKIINELSILFANVRQIDGGKRRRNGKRHQENYIDPNFKATEMLVKKFEGHELLSSEIQVIVNKLAPATYDKLKEEIFNKINEIIEKSDKEQKNSFVTSLVILLSRSKFYSEINVKLYGELLDKYEIFKNSKKILLNEYKVLSESIKVVSQENYDDFCENNALNDRRRSMGLFIANMVKNDLLNKEVIFEKILSYQKKLKDNMEIENMKLLNEEITENIYILIVNVISVLYKDSDWNKVIENVKEATKIIVKEKKSFSSRSKFKHMDIITEYNKFLKDNNIEL